MEVCDVCKTIGKPVGFILQIVNMTGEEAKEELRETYCNDCYNRIRFTLEESRKSGY